MVPALQKAIEVEALRGKLLAQIGALALRDVIAERLYPAYRIAEKRDDISIVSRFDSTDNRSMPDEEPEPVPFFLRQALKRRTSAGTSPVKAKISFGEYCRSRTARKVVPVVLGMCRNRTRFRLHLLPDSLRARRFHAIGCKEGDVCSGPNQVKTAALNVERFHCRRMGNDDGLGKRRRSTAFRRDSQH